MTTPTDVDGYLARVRAALDDLPPAAREELLEDLSEHLAEIAAEDEESLEARLGAPEAYAAELRAAAGLSGSAPRRPLFSTARARLQVLDTKIGPLVGYERTSDFLRLLRPGWWVLRGYLAGLVAVLLFNGGSAPGLIPRLGGSMVLALVVILACVVGSIWLGRVTVRLGVWPRRVIAVGTVGLVLYGFVAFVNADSTIRSDPYRVEYVDSSPWGDSVDLYVYDEDGRLLRNVRVYNQNGRPIEVGNAVICQTGFNPGRLSNAYPRCPQFAPFGTGPDPIAPSSPGPSTAPSPGPSPTG